eukprot:1831665-Alexandrium_andersonii.AAC.1
MRQWPKRCVILGAEGSQWPFMEGRGHNKLAQHLSVIGDQLVQQGVLVMHGRQMWNDPDNIQGACQLPDAVCQFHAVPPRPTSKEIDEGTLVSIEVDRRWADYFCKCDEFYVDRTHYSFKANQMAFRDTFSSLPIPPGRYCPALVPYSKSDTPRASTLLVRQRVYSSCYNRSRELLHKPIGIPPAPKDPSLQDVVAQRKSAEGGEKRIAPAPEGPPSKKTPLPVKPPAGAVGGAKAVAQPMASPPPAAKADAPGAPADVVGGDGPPEVASAAGIAVKSPSVAAVRGARAMGPAPPPPPKAKG